jgi:serine phosphatase RsbU (regulator of sigma subunit)
MSNRGMNNSLAESTLFSCSNAKQAFRMAESLLAALPFRDDRQFLQEAAGRLSEILDEGAALRPAFGLYRRQGAHFGIAEGSGEGRFETLLPPGQSNDILREASIYSNEPQPTACWTIGARKDWAIAWQFRSPLAPEDIVGLEAARLVIGQRLTESGFSGMLQQAAAIQRSMLPGIVPAFPGFDIAARSEPADEVGGDLYDLLPLASDAIGFAIADASGHGLPAALEARDVAMGLRMGAARHLKIGATIEKLNAILCHTTLTSRFVSLVYGELESDGRFQFVNAGHPPPVLIHEGQRRSFAEGGMVLGVSSPLHYRNQHGEIPTSGVLLLVTDGILERHSPSGEEFGAARTEDLVRELADRPAALIVSALFEALDGHSGGAPVEDDATVVVIRREK